MRVMLTLVLTTYCACAAFGAAPLGAAPAGAPSMTWESNPLRNSNARQLKKMTAAFQMVLGKPAKKFIVGMVKPGLGTELFYDGQGREKFEWVVDDGMPALFFNNCGGLAKTAPCDRIEFKFPSLRYSAKKKAFVTEDDDAVLKRTRKGKLKLTHYKIFLRKHQGAYGWLHLGVALYE